MVTREELIKAAMDQQGVTYEVAAQQADGEIAYGNYLYDREYDAYKDNESKAYLIKKVKKMILNSIYGRRTTA